MNIQSKQQRKISNKPEFRSEHNLPFEVAEYPMNIDPKTKWMLFRVGTCEGLWTSTQQSYDILAVTNRIPGNGHFNDVLQWFEQSCRRDKKALRILEVWNSNFKRHLIENRSFRDIGDCNVLKNFK
ncbi:hypothetical protein SDC9_171571 [bioreactor metagenome]|uniref:Uncharacterized protein n=1 Tax=bioreactor metagenome TaxID=1076179 RepID=A0A645GB93_9ZZZZ|nr:hypothetical protein [Paludibacter sp.]